MNNVIIRKIYKLRKRKKIMVVDHGYFGLAITLIQHPCGNRYTINEFFNRITRGDIVFLEASGSYYNKKYLPL